MSGNARIELEPAFLIHRRAWRETSALLELFTRGHGRVAVVARGARRPRSGLRVALSPFVGLLVGWSGRGEMGTLRSAETRGVAPQLAGDALLAGLYLNELLLRLTHRHDPHPELFDAYDQALTGLGGAAPLEHTLRLFEKRMLEAVGYALLLEQEAGSGEPVVRERRYVYRPDHGPEPAGAGGADTVEVSGSTLLGLASESLLDGPGQREAKRLMRLVLRAHLGERPLASRELFRGLDA